MAGGFGSAVAELLHAHGLHDVRLKIIGVPDKFIEHGAPAILRELYGLSSGHIKEVVRELVRPGSSQWLHAAAHHPPRMPRTAAHTEITPTRSMRSLAEPAAIWYYCWCREQSRQRASSSIGRAADS